MRSLKVEVVASYFSSIKPNQHPRPRQVDKVPAVEANCWTESHRQIVKQSQTVLRSLLEVNFLAIISHELSIQSLKSYVRESARVFIYLREVAIPVQGIVLNHGFPPMSCAYMHISWAPRGMNFSLAHI